MESQGQWLERLRRETESRLERIAEMQEELAEVAGEARSPDRMVWAKVGPNGAPSDLKFEIGALRYEPNQLARIVLQTFQEAAAKAAEQLNDVVRPALGDGVDLDSLMQGRTPDDVRQHVEGALADFRRDARTRGG
ncbi:MAG: hypothetical protein GEV03_08685 [Streptosporangiales bacterium]|nr:hypothetical protein [Streptosporangiales bacterium]